MDGRLRRTVLLLVLLVIASGVSLVLYTVLPPVSDWTADGVTKFLSSLGIGLTGVIASALAAFRARRSAQSERQIYRQLSESAPVLNLTNAHLQNATLSITTTDGHQADASPEADELRLIALWNEAQNRLALYQQLVKRQSSISFSMLMAVATAGFLVVGLVAWRASEAQTTAGGLAAGAVGAIGAGLAAYIGRTFQQTYSEASLRLINYFEQPLRLTRLLSAERLLGRLEGKAHDDAVLDIIRAALDRDDEDSRFLSRSSAARTAGRRRRRPTTEAKKEPESSVP